MAQVGRGEGGEGRLVANSVLICALAYNLVFCIQELFLVLPKAAMPGLHPVLFHNNHSWTGDHPLVPLLQGAGAVATMVAGALCMAWMARRPPASQGWRLLALWMAVMGFGEALPQVVIGTFIPQNDVGMAMGFLGLGPAAKAIASVLALVALAFVGRWAAPRFRALGDARSGMAAVFRRAVIPLLVLAPMAAPFRAPNAWIEVVFPPAVDALAGVLAIQAWGWRAPAEGGAPISPTPLWKPVLALLAVLAVFQILLRPGVHIG